MEGNSIFGRGNSKPKVLEAELSVGCLRNTREVCVAGTELIRERIIDEIRGMMGETGQINGDVEGHHKDFYSE